MSTLKKKHDDLIRKEHEGANVFPKVYRFLFVLVVICGELFFISFPVSLSSFSFPVVLEEERLIVLYHS